MATVLNDSAIQDWTAARKGWAHAGEIIEKTYEFESFVPAVEFVNRVAGLAEDANHHPDIDIRYNRVRIGLATHDAGGITEKDTGLAERIDAAVSA